MSELQSTDSEFIPLSLLQSHYTLSRARAALPGTDDHAAHPFRVSCVPQLNLVHDAAPTPPEPRLFV